jgi:hypothetical protein
MKIQKLILKYGIFLAISLGLFLSFNCLFSAPLRADQEQVNILPIEGEPGYFAATTDGRSSIYVVCAVSNAGSPGGDELRLIKSPDFGQTWEEKQTVSVCNKIGNMVFDVGIDRFRGAIYVPVLYQRKLPGGGYYCDVALYQSMDDGKSFEKNENLPSERFYTPCPIKGNETVKSLVDPKNGSVVLSIATPCSERNNRVYATKTENGSEFSPWEEIAAQEEPAREGPLIKTVTNEDGDTFSIVYEKTAGKS